MENLRDELRKQSKKRLNEMCKANGLSISGTKETVINRIIEFKRNKSNATLDEIMEDNNVNFDQHISESPACDGDQNNECQVINDIDLVDNLKQQLKLIETQRLKIMQDIERIEQTKNTTTTQKNINSEINLNYLDNLLYEFSDEGFLHWSQHVKTCQNTYKIDDGTMKIFAIKKLKGKALRWFHSKSEHLTMNLDDLLGQMHKLFGSKLQKIELRRKFENRLWNVNENFADYFHEKVILAGSLDLAEEELCEFIIEGMNDAVLQNQAKIIQFKKTLLIV